MHCRQGRPLVVTRNLDAWAVGQDPPIRPHDLQHTLGLVGAERGLNETAEIEHHQRMFAWASEVKGQPTTRVQTVQRATVSATGLRSVPDTSCWRG
jgi:hypothetical protein